MVWAYPKGQPGPLQSGAKYLTPEINDVVSWNSNLETRIILSGHTVDGQNSSTTGIRKEGSNRNSYSNGNKIFLDDKTNTTKILLKVSEDKFHEITLSPDGVIIKTPTPITQETQSTWDQTAKRIIISEENL